MFVACWMSLIIRDCDCCARSIAVRIVPYFTLLTPRTFLVSSYMFPQPASLSCEQNTVAFLRRLVRRLLSAWRSVFVREEKAWLQRLESRGLLNVEAPPTIWRLDYSARGVETTINALHTAGALLVEVMAWLWRAQTLRAAARRCGPLPCVRNHVWAFMMRLFAMLHE